MTGQAEAEGPDEFVDSPPRLDDLAVAGVERLASLRRQELDLAARAQTTGHTLQATGHRRAAQAYLYGIEELSLLRRTLRHDEVEA